MAKKKKNNPQAQKPMTEKRFLAEKANKLPIYKCIITKGWEENGEAQVIVARRRGNGNLCAASFLVDLWCTGVKDAYGDVNMTDVEFERIVNFLPKTEEIDYPTAHNIIYGAVEFAGEAEIEPAEEYWKWKQVLEEDTDDVPLVDIEFGRNGKYVLMAARGSREALLVPELIKRLGTKFNYVLGDPDQEDFDLPEDISDEDWERMRSHLEEMTTEDNRLPKEPFHHDYPDYPDSPVGNHQFIADELLDPANYSSLPQEFIDKVTALPSDEAVDDICKVALYTIGSTYKGIRSIKDDLDYEADFDLENGALLHCLVLLTLLRNPRGLETILEIASQTNACLDFHLGDFTNEILSDAIYATGSDNLDRVMEFIYEPGHTSEHRDAASEAVIRIAAMHPARRNEIVELLRKLLVSMRDRLPEQKGCDALFAGFLMGRLMDLKTPELLPEIKGLFDLELVNRSIAGDYDEVSRYINDPEEEAKEFDEPEPLKIYEFLKD